MVTGEKPNFHQFLLYLSQKVGTFCCNSLKKSINLYFQFVLFQFGIFMFQVQIFSWKMQKTISVRKRVIKNVA